MRKPCSRRTRDWTASSRRCELNRPRLTQRSQLPTRPPRIPQHSFLILLANRPQHKPPPSPKMTLAPTMRSSSSRQVYRTVPPTRRRLKINSLSPTAISVATALRVSQGRNDNTEPFTRPSGHLRRSHRAIYLQHTPLSPQGIMIRLGNMCGARDQATKPTAIRAAQHGSPFLTSALLLVQPTLSHRDGRRGVSETILNIVLNQSWKDDSAICGHQVLQLHLRGLRIFSRRNIVTPKHNRTGSPYQDQDKNIQAQFRKTTTSR